MNIVRSKSDTIWPNPTPRKGKEAHKKSKTLNSLLMLAKIRRTGRLNLVKGGGRTTNAQVTGLHELGLAHVRRTITSVAQLTARYTAGRRTMSSREGCLCAAAPKHAGYMDMSGNDWHHMRAGFRAAMSDFALLTLAMRSFMFAAERHRPDGPRSGFYQSALTGR
jgi:hypothetical protein